MNQNHLDYALAQLKNILDIPSPSGFTANISQYLQEELKTLGYKPWATGNGGVMVEIGGADEKNGLVLSCHADTLGGMVAEVKASGRLKLTRLGLLSPNNTEAENVTIHTRDGHIYSGTYQLINPAWHVNLRYNDTPRTFDNMEVVIDEMIGNRKDARDLGINIGDIVCFDPRLVITESGYIKSRFLDDKLSVAILLAFARQVKEENIIPKRRVYIYFTVFEEVGHGAGGLLPEGVTEILAVDMGCVGDGLDCDETMVSICAKDSDGPSSYDVVTELVNLAEEHNIKYALDVYPNYQSDADVAVRAGNNIRHCVMGAGVAASHGYERSHIDGLRNTFDLVSAYAL